MANNIYYNKIQSLSEQLDVYFNALVPEEGKCASYEGEALRAWSKMSYRKYNDGDSIFEEDGGSCNAAFNFLTESYGLDYSRGANEEQIIFEMGEQILGRLEEIDAERLPLTPNSEDYLDYAQESLFYDEDEDFVYDYEDEEY